MSTPAISSSRPRPIRFGDFELDVRSGELRSNGSRVVIAEQPLQVLLALLERPGALVTRDELRQRLWQSDTFVDFEHGLNAAVKRLRDVLGDSADRPRYIETVPRRGYRLIAPLENGQSLAEPLPPVLPSAEPRTQARWWWAVGLGALTLVGILAGWRSFRDPRGEARAVTRPLTRLTFGPGLQTDVTWSPDGRRVAYASNRNGNFDIWVQDVSGGEPRALTTSAAPDTQPAWSSTSDLIVFRSERDGGGLFTVSSSGGPARRLTSFGERPHWLPGGREIFFRGPLDTITNLYVVSADGDGPPREVLQEFLAGGRWEWAAPHPDGRISMIGVHRTRQFGVFTVDREGHGVTAVKPSATLLQELGWGDPKISRRFQWAPSGTALYFEVTSNGLPSLWKVAVAPVTLEWLSAERLTTGAANAVSSAVSPDGDRLAFTSYQGLPTAWVFPFDAVTGRLEGDGRAVTDDDMAISSLGMWPDAKSIVYNGNRAGAQRVGVFTTNLETGTTSALAADARGPLPSRDGTQVSYLLRRVPGGAPRDGPLESLTEFAVAVRDRTGSERLVSRWTTRGVMLASDWTLDGTALLGSYWEPVGTGPVVLALWPASRAIAEKPDRVVLQAPGHRFWQGKFSPDGRWISFVVERADRPEHLEMGVAAASGAEAGDWKRIVTDHEQLDKPRWAPDGKTLYFLSRKPSGNFNVWGVRIDPLRATPIGEPFQITHFDTSALIIDPDMSNTSEMDIAGRWLALTMRSVSGSIWMLANVDR